MAFETRFDGRPMWRIIYDDLLAKAKIGDIITYDQLRKALPGVEEASVRGSYFRACKEVESEMSRTFANVRGVGYRMVEAREHEGLARAHHKRSRRQIGKAIRKARSADRSGLSAEEKARLDTVELTLTRHAEMMQHLGSRVDRNEAALKEARRKSSEQVAAVSHDQSALAERLARLEAQIASQPSVPSE